MRTIHYQFTQSELLALRDACQEHWQAVKHLDPVSPMVQDSRRALVSLKEQFKQDYLLWRDPITC